MSKHGQTLPADFAMPANIARMGETTGRTYLKLGPEDRIIIKRLTTPNGWIFTLWMVFHLGIWLLEAWLVVNLEGWGWKLPFVFLLANQLHALTVLQHDCGHGSAYTSELANLWMGRLLAWFIYMPFTTFTIVHKRHHAYLGQPNKDSDEWFYAGGTWQVFLRECLFLPYFIIDSVSKDFPKPVRRRILRELAFNTTSWLGLISGSIYFGFFQDMLFALLLPMLVLAIIINPISRGYEHFPMARMKRGKPQRLDLRFNTITVTNPLLGFLWANITYHVEHHLYPKVPFFRLPELHRLIRKKGYCIESFPLYGLFSRHHKETF